MYDSYVLDGLVEKLQDGYLAKVKVASYLALGGCSYL